MSLEINTEDFWKEIDKRVVEHRIEKKLMREEITKLREQVKAQAAVIESLKSAIDRLWNGCENLHDNALDAYDKGYTRAMADSCKEALSIPTDSTQILAEVRRAERDALKSKVDRLKYIMASNAYKDGATLSVEICVLDDEAVGDFSERIYWFVDRAMEGRK